jgi:Pyrimidine dimer DNA glycosylase
MRIWSLHPKYIDSKRLVAQWREALLCRAVLEGKTIGYLNHPQFLRVKNHSQPHYFINSFLFEIWQEGRRRKYNFDKSKLMEGLLSKYGGPLDLMEVTDGQLEYEFGHLQKKLGEFDEQYQLNEQYLNEEGIEPNPCFLKVFGDIMKFEKIKDE